MTRAELDHAAHEILQANGQSQDTKLPYFDHISGYELQDYTQRSGDERSGSITPNVIIAPDPADDGKQEAVYITTL